MIPFPNLKVGGAVAAAAPLRWSDTDRSANTVLSDGNRTIGSTGTPGDNLNRGTTSKSSGKQSFRISTNTNRHNCGIANAIPGNNSSPGYTGENSVLFQMSPSSGNWFIYFNGSNIESGNTSPGPVDVLLDLNAGLYWFLVNGTPIRGNPGSGTGGLQSPPGPLFPMANTANSDVLHTIDGSVSRYTGFSAWS